MIGILMEYAEQSTSNARADLFSNQKGECKISQTLSGVSDVQTSSLENIRKTKWKKIILIL